MTTILSLLPLLFSLASTPAQATTQDILPQPITVGAGELHQVKLDQPLYIHKLLIQAESASTQPAFFDVIIHGQTVGTILTPAGDPTYIVAARTETDSIEFRSLSGGGFRIVKLYAVTGVESSLDSPGPAQSYSDIARALIRVIEKIEPSLSPVEQWHHSLPIKVGAAQLYAVAYGYTSTHESRLLDAALELILRIDASFRFFSYQITKGNSFELITELWSLRERLESLTLKPSHLTRKKYNK